MFSRANGEELWVMLIEKAYAKLHGCYGSLRYGFTHHGMLDLTGCPTVNVTFPKDKPDFETIEDEAEQIWDSIQEADDRGFLISGETPGYDDQTEGGGGKDAPDGLVPGHAYSIIEVKEGLGVRLLKIRNPWGKYEWGGDWSDQSELWTEEMIEHFHPVFDTNDGTFWMCFEDFIMNFDSVNICHVRNWNEVRLKGKFIRASEKSNDGNSWVLNKFYYTFGITEDDTEVHIGIHQEDERILGADRRPPLDIALAIFEVDHDTDEMNLIK